VVEKKLKKKRKMGPTSQQNLRINFVLVCSRSFQSHFLVSAGLSDCCGLELRGWAVFRASARLCSKQPVFLGLEPIRCSCLTDAMDLCRSATATNCNTLTQACQDNSTLPATPAAQPDRGLLLHLHPSVSLCERSCCNICTIIRLEFLTL